MNDALEPAPCAIANVSSPPAMHEEAQGEARGDVRAAHGKSRRYLFVCGVGRSGTTALARCLNRHPRIVLGVERYGRALMTPPCADFDYCGLFVKDRFFDFRPADSSVGRGPPPSGWPKRLYDDAYRKYDEAIYFGDKIPGLYRRAPFLHETFPGCKVVFLLREPVAVAMSWQARAEDPSDGWFSHNGFAAAITQWNASLAATMLAKTILGDDLIVALFEDVFSRGGRGLERLLAKLQLDSAEIASVDDLLGVGWRIVERDVRACPVRLRYAEEHVDHGTYEWFKEEARR